MMDVSVPRFKKDEIYDRKSRKVIVHTLVVAITTLLGLVATFAWDYEIVGATELATSMHLQAIVILSLSILLTYTIRSQEY